MRLDKIFTWFISIIMSTTALIQQQPMTTKPGALLNSKEDWSASTSNRTVLCPTNTMDVILGDSNVDYILDLNLMQIDDMYEYTKECNYKPFINMNMAPIVMSDPFKYFVIRQGSIYKELFDIDIETRRSTPKTSLWDYFKQKKYSCTRIGLKIETIQKEINRLESPKRKDLYKIRDTMLTLNTILKGMLMQEHKQIEDAIYSFQVYIKENHLELKSAYTRIKNEYDNYKFDQEKQSNAQIDIKNINFLKNSINTERKKNLKLEYLINSVYIQLYQINDFIANSGWVEKSMKTPKVVEYTNMLNNILGIYSSPNNYYYVVKKTDNLDKLLDVVNYLYVTYKDIIVQIDAELETRILAGYEHLNTNDVSFSSSTKQKWQHYIDFSKEILKKLILKYNNAINGIRTLLKVTRGKYQTEKKTIAEMLSHQFPLNDDVNKVKPTLDLHKTMNKRPIIKYNKPANMEVRSRTADNIKRSIEKKILYGHMDWEYDNLLKSDFLLFKRYTIHNTKNYTLCYRHLIDMVNKYNIASDEVVNKNNPASHMYNLVPPNMPTLEEDIEYKKKKTNITLNMAMDMISTLREIKSHPATKNRDGIESDTDIQILNRLATVMSAVYIFDTPNPKSSVNWNLFLDSNLFEPTIHNNNNMFQQTVISNAQELVDLLQNITGISSKELNDSLSISVRTSKETEAALSATMNSTNTNYDIIYNNYFEAIIKLFLTMQTNIQKKLIYLGMLHTDYPISDPHISSHFFPGIYEKTISQNIKSMIDQYVLMNAKYKVISTMSSLCAADDVIDIDDESDYNYEDDSRPEENDNDYNSKAQENDRPEENGINRLELDLTALTIVKDTMDTYFEVKNGNAETDDGAPHQSANPDVG
ncbi:hypothetical protein NERG_00821 [Nematocida ausubeli]|uniref:Uncharacterized protein n=1 Tax=Nematocida ausubeli (strain ATCC PRA-371 / ERTm2) TaxID=1913371 RepID=H8ZB72_NEMA1|nr:hypothetical protein NERG_00821 [Nematocida ausubeli]